jgi:hypothetical protein
MFNNRGDIQGRAHTEDQAKALQLLSLPLLASTPLDWLQLLPPTIYFPNPIPQPSIPETQARKQSQSELLFASVEPGELQRYSIPDQ